MRIHSAYLTESQVKAAVSLAGATITGLSRHGSRKRGNAFELKLSGNSPYRQNGGEYPAASWDQWGIVLSALWDQDAGMTCAAYSDRDMFDRATGSRFRALRPEDAHRRHRWRNVAPYSSECDCGAVQRWGPGLYTPPQLRLSPAETQAHRRAEATELEWWQRQRERALGRVPS
jgi:hypothetical protein